MICWVVLLKRLNQKVILNNTPRNNINNNDIDVMDTNISNGKIRESIKDIKKRTADAIKITSEITLSFSKISFSFFIVLAPLILFSKKAIKNNFWYMKC